jgi:predicted SAM-dependent methyltransferase
MTDRQTLKLNLGSGAIEIEGYENLDRKNGHEVYPLDDYADGTVDEIRASHILEHFSHRKTLDVVKHWAGKLRPGGVMKLAVPNLTVLSQEYLDGKPTNIQGFLMGGQSDDDDLHRALFDEEALREVMTAAGLTRITHWNSNIGDCAGLPVSLNLTGYKPLSDGVPAGKVGAVLGAPRFGPIIHARCALMAFAKTQIPCVISQGCFWHQLISEAMEAQLAEGFDYILTLDYDSVFTAEDVVELYRVMEAYPNIDAACAVQSKRQSEHALFGIRGEDGKPKERVYMADFDINVTPVSTGHFGLTMFRASRLRDHERPWMVPQPNDEGRWTDGKMDADIDFWNRWHEADRNLYLANHVVIGHQEEVITWPDEEFKPVHQPLTDYMSDGKPPGTRI